MTAQQWNLAENLFNDALELPPADRVLWVQRSCERDPFVADAVLKMLEADANPGDEIRSAVRTAVKRWMLR